MAQKPRRLSAVMDQLDDIKSPGNLLDAVRGPSSRRRARNVTPPAKPPASAPAPIPPTPQAKPVQESEAPQADSSGEGEVVLEEVTVVAKPKAKYDRRMSISFPGSYREDMKLLAWMEEVSDATLIRRAVRDYLIKNAEQVKKARELRGENRQSA